MATKTKRAASYLRVSGKGQVGGGGFDRQRDAVRRYAKANGFDLVEEFRDEGVSGTRELEDRAGLAALLDRIESNGIDAVLVESADRLARTLLVSEVVLGQFSGLGVSVIAASSGQDLTVSDDDPTRKLIRQVLGAVSEFEKQTTVLKLRAARARVRSREGRCEGRKPFGDRPNEKATLERMRELYRKQPDRPRLSFGAIATALNDDNYATRSGKPWDRNVVRRILKRKKARPATTKPKKFQVSADSRCG